jgi:hypothetical protein
MLGKLPHRFAIIDVLVIWRTTLGFSAPESAWQG